MHDEQQVWAALGYICPVYARYVETSGKGPGVGDRGGRPKDGGLGWYDKWRAGEKDREVREERVSTRTGCMYTQGTH
jgi:hypothetical protein